LVAIAVNFFLRIKRGERYAFKAFWGLGILVFGWFAFVFFMLLDRILSQKKG
jgi:hypothetical protein